MLSFIENLTDFFQSLFSNDPTEARNRKELRLIQNELKAFKPLYFQRKPKAFLPELGKAFFTLHASLAPISSILAKTIGQSEASQSRRNRDYLIEGLLGPTFREKRESLRYERIKTQLEGSAKPDKEAIKIRDEFKIYYRRVNALDKNKLNISLAEADNLWDLCAYDYQRLINYFDPTIDLTNPTQAPKGGPSFNNALSEDLKDFYYIWASLQLEVNLAQILDILLDKLGADTGENEKKIAKILEAVKRFRNKTLPPRIILNLIKAWDEDPFIRLPLMQRGRDEIQNYLNSIEQQFNRDLDRANREINEGAITGEVAALFGKTPLMELENYNNAFSQKLLEAGLPGFSNLKAFQVLKTFTVLYFDKTIRDLVNRIMVEGFFEMKNFQTSLTENYYACERISGDIITFEENLGKEGRHTTVALDKYLGEISSGVDRMELCQRIVGAINKRSGEIIEEKTKALLGLTQQIQEILNDFKKPTPEIISNIKGFGGQQNREFMASLVEGYNQCTRFLKIMKHFVVLKKKL